MKEFFRNNGIYYALYFTALVFSSYFLLCYEKPILHQMTNYWVGNKYVDFFYKYFTHVGDGFFAVFVGIIVLMMNRKKGLYVLLSYAFAGVTSSIIKHVSNYPRPHHIFCYYRKHGTLKLIDGIEILGEYSFPSGHSTAAFAVFTALALLSKNQWLKVLFWIIAVNAAFSRVYISQHWLIDIVAGSFVGVFYATVLYFVFYRTRKFDPVLDKPLFVK